MGKFLLFMILALTHPAIAQELKIRLHEDLGNLNWNHGEVSAMVVQQLMTGLTQISETGAALPAVASSWSANKNNTEFIFKLNPKAKWSDRSPVCAQDFVRGWLRGIDPANPSPYNHLFFIIKNAKEISEKKSNFSTFGAIATNCHTLKISTTNPAVYLPHLLGHWVFFPLHNKDSDQKQPKFFNGSYILKDWVLNSFYLLEPNSNSTNPGKRHLKFVVIADDSQALRLAEAGELSLIKDIPALEYKRLEKSPQLVKSKSLVHYFLGFNVNKAPFDNKNLRCALSRAINQDEIPMALTGTEEPSHSLIPSILGNYSLRSLHNNKSANDLIKKIPKQDLENLEVNFYTKNIHIPLMEWIQNQWKKTLNISVQLKPNDQKTYWAKLQANPPSIFLSGTTAPYPHPYAFLSEFLMNNTANWGHYNSIIYNNLVNQLLISQSKLRENVIKAQRQVLQDDCAVIPLYFRTTIYYKSIGCDGLKINPMGWPQLNNFNCFKSN